MNKKYLNKIIQRLKLHAKNLGGYLYIETILDEIKEPDFIAAKNRNDYQGLSSIARLYAEKISNDSLISGKWLDKGLNVFHITKISPDVLKLKKYPDYGKQQKLANLSWKILVPTFFAILNPIVAVLITNYRHENKLIYVPNNIEINEANEMIKEDLDSYKKFKLIKDTIDNEYKLKKITKHNTQYSQ